MTTLNIFEKIVKISKTKIVRFLIGFLATGLWSGKSKYAPGTFGSFLAIIISVFLSKLSLSMQFLVVLITIFGGIFITKLYLIVENKVGDDPKEVVIDEISAIFLSVLIANWLFLTGGEAKTLSWEHFLFIFSVFRAFDVLKPWPICVIDKNMKSATGIMLDDLLAGIATSLLFIAIFA